MRQKKRQKKVRLQTLAKNMYIFIYKYTHILDIFLYIYLYTPYTFEVQLTKQVFGVYHDRMGCKDFRTYQGGRSLDALQFGTYQPQSVDWLTKQEIPMGPKMKLM